MSQYVRVDNHTMTKHVSQQTYLLEHIPVKSDFLIERQRVCATTAGHTEKEKLPAI